MARVRLWVRGAKHYLPKLNHSKANPYPPATRLTATSIAAQPSQTSASLIQDFPAEIVSEIARVVLSDTLFWQDTIRSWNYTFISIGKVLKHPLVQVCRSWRRIILQFILSSRKDRQDTYIAATPQDLIFVQESLPGIEMRGFLLLLGSPNDLLLGPADDVDTISTLATQGSSALHAIEAVEWLEASTAGFSYVGDAPDIDDALERFCQSYGTIGASSEDHEQNAHLLCEAIVAVAHTACAKVLDLLSLLPHVKTAEIPVWVIMVAALTDASLTADQQVTFMRSLGLDVVTGEELRAKLQALTARLERLHIVGYSFGPFGVVPWRTDGTWLEEYVGVIASAVELSLRERFIPNKTSGVQKALPVGSLDHLKGLAWRDNPLDEVVEYDHPALEMILNYPASFQLEEFFAINKDIGEKAESLLYTRALLTPPIQPTARKLVAPPVPFPYLSAPVLSHSGATLRKLTLHLSFDTTLEDDEDGDEPPHHCTFIPELSKLLPAIEYVDISVPAVCECAFHGLFQPRKPTGTFKLTIVSEAWPFCSPRSTTFHAATWQTQALLQLLKAAQVHFDEAKGWDIQLHLAAPDRPSHVPGKLYTRIDTTP
jgi:hypothetical protein